MYMDTDSVIVKSLNKFRNEEATLGQETSSAVGEDMNRNCSNDLSPRCLIKDLTRHFSRSEQEPNIDDQCSK